MCMCMCVSLPTTISNLHNFFDFFFVGRLKTKFSFIYIIIRIKLFTYFIFIFHFSFTFPFTTGFFFWFSHLLFGNYTNFFSHFSHHPCATMRKSEWKIFFFPSGNFLEVVLVCRLVGYFVVTTLKLLFLVINSAYSAKIAEFNLFKKNSWI